jgi:hypothetical protein
VGERTDDSLRRAGRGAAAADTLDEGLPVALGNGPPRQWSRRNAENSFGHYRHTVVYIGGGEGENYGSLTTTLPSAGLWELEMHIPFLTFLPPEARGTWNLEIVSADGREAVSFDATAGVVGWNLIGGYRLPAGEVSVVLSDRSDGRLVVADAIAWSPVGRPAAGSGASE